MRRITLCFLLFLVACFSVQAGYLGVFGISFGQQVKDGTEYYSLGWEFQLNPALAPSVTVVGLGSYSYGFTTPQQVGLWEDTDSGPVLLASTFVTTDDPVKGGGFFFRDIAPVVLTAGKTYVVGSQGNRNATFIGGFAQAPFISWTGNRYAAVGSPANDPLVYPADSDPSVTGYFGGNFEYELGSPVPEPGTLLLVGGGLLAAAWRRRQANRRAAASRS